MCHCIPLHATWQPVGFPLDCCSLLLPLQRLLGLRRIMSKWSLRMHHCGNSSAPLALRWLSLRRAGEHILSMERINPSENPFHCFNLSHPALSLRRMFPQLRVKLSGLNPTLRYILLLDIVPVDSSRYRFQDNSWQVVGGAEARLPDRVFIHPDSPATGDHWQNRSISFHRAKLTNNTLDAQGYVSKKGIFRYPF